MEHTPRQPNEFVGKKNAALAASLLAAARAIAPDARWKIVLFGPWGNGKTSLANMIATALVAAPIDIEKINGRSLTIEVVRDWVRGAAYGSLFGGFKVKQIEEVDLVTPVAQELLLTYLDDLPAGCAVIATSNGNMSTLTDRFATRFSPIKVESPTSEEIAAFLVKKWKLPKPAANFIAVGCCGNVRDAFLRADNFAILGDVVERPGPMPTFAAKTHTAVARAAYEASLNENDRRP